MVLCCAALRSVDREEWNACAAGSDRELNPFVLWEFLHAAEASESACAATGWLPQHLLLREGATGRLLGCCPLYLKSHSYGEVRACAGRVGRQRKGGRPSAAGAGMLLLLVQRQAWERSDWEGPGRRSTFRAQCPTRLSHLCPARALPALQYVFDHSWADAFHRLGLGRYYPKLQSCVPFSPVPGPRLLARPGPAAPAIRQALADTLQQVHRPACRHACVRHMIGTVRGARHVYADCHPALTANKPTAATGGN